MLQLPKGHIARKLTMSIFLVMCMYVLGTMFFMYAEGWTMGDSIYFITMTVTTVGYGDVVPKTAVGKAFSIALAWVGISIAFFAIYSIAEAREKVVDQRLLNKLRTLRNIAQARTGRRDWPQPDINIKVRNAFRNKMR